MDTPRILGPDGISQLSTAEHGRAGMRRWEYVEPSNVADVAVVRTVTEADIMRDYFPYWSELMRKAGVSDGLRKAVSSPCDNRDSRPGQGSGFSGVRCGICTQRLQRPFGRIAMTTEDRAGIVARLETLQAQLVPYVRHQSRCERGERAQGRCTCGLAEFFHAPTEPDSAFADIVAEIRRLERLWDMAGTDALPKHVAQLEAHLATATQQIAALQGLIVKWRKEQAEYPVASDERAVGAAIAVCLCADELEAALRGIAEPTP